MEPVVLRLATLRLLPELRLTEAEEDGCVMRLRIWTDFGEEVGGEFSRLNAEGGV